MHRSGFHPVKHAHQLQEIPQDSYKIIEKIPEPAVCPDCEAVFYDGQWQWLPAPSHAHQLRCPACHRMHDQFPAGYVSLEGDFFESHRQEVLHLVQHQAAHEKPWHPLQRIMSIETIDEHTLVTTTDLHLARNIGELLHRTYQGELEYHYNPEDNLLRVIWSR